MKQFKLTLLLTVLMSMLGLQAFADWDKSTKIYEGGLYYYLDKDNLQAQVTSMPSGKYTGDIMIPSTFTYNETNYNVTSIGDRAFFSCPALTSVTIPNSVTSIGDLAFNSCDGLTSITIPNSVTSIGESAFSWCTGLTSVTIPNSVTSIGESAFYSCSALTSVTIPNSVTSIGSSAFSGCSKLTSVALNSNAIVSKAYTSSSYNVNYIFGTQVTEYIIGDEVTSIGNSAFSDCFKLTSVTIPNSVMSIGDYAFSGCSKLTSVTIPNSVMSIGDYAFSGCSKLTSVTIPNSVTSIGDNAFYGTAWYNNQLDGLVYAGKVAYKYKGTMPANTGISIKEGTLGIADRAFYGFPALTSVTIPNSVTSIGEEAFSYCSGLTSVTIPNSVMSIGNSAFRDCTSLTSVTTLNPTPVAITEYVFTNRKKATLYVPKGSKTAYQAADYWKEFKEIVEIDVTSIKAVENEQIAGSDETGNWYTLDGRRLSGKPTKRGIYIVNGRKVIVN